MFYVLNEKDVLPKIRVFWDFVRKRYTVTKVVVSHDCETV